MANSVDSAAPESGVPQRGVVAVPARVGAAAEQGRSASSARTLERLTGRYRAVVLAVVATAIVLVAQLAEDVADSPPLQMLPPTMSVPRWTVVILVGYIFGMAAFVNRTVERSLESLRHVTDVDDAAFAAYRARMARLPSAIDAFLLLLSLVIVVVLFSVVGSDLLLDDPVTGQSRFMPSDPIASGLIGAGYVVIGWAFLRLTVGTARLARLLADLAKERLRISVFDTSSLIPFGNIALALAAAPAGVIAILVIGLGSPTTVFAWTVLVIATLAIVLALLMPLRGIHRQMAAAKYGALTTLAGRIDQVYADVSRREPIDGSEWPQISNTTNALVQMRKTVQEMPTWPFRDTVAFGRAVLIASAPLIYTTLSELIRVLWIAPLTK